jgi:transposase
MFTKKYQNDIYNDWVSNSMTNREIAIKHGVTESTVYNIKTKAEKMSNFNKKGRPVASRAKRRGSKSGKVEKNDTESEEEIKYPARTKFTSLESEFIDNILEEQTVRKNRKEVEEVVSSKPVKPVVVFKKRGSKRDSKGYDDFLATYSAGSN